MFTSMGRLVYDPARGSMKENRTAFWAIIEVDPEITRYYRHQINKIGNPLKLPNCDIVPALGDAHISVIRGERPSPSKMDLWKKYDGRIVSFRYSEQIKRHGDFWFIDVDCPFGIQMRQEFGFRSHWSLHLTIGRRKLFNRKNAEVF